LYLIIHDNALNAKDFFENQAAFDYAQVTFRKFSCINFSETSVQVFNSRISKNYAQSAADQSGTGADRFGNF